MGDKQAVEAPAGLLSDEQFRPQQGLIQPHVVVGGRIQGTGDAADDLRPVGKAFANGGIEADVTELGIAVVEICAVENGLLDNDRYQRAEEKVGVFR